jgi:hypothetical protein
MPKRHRSGGFERDPAAARLMGCRSESTVGTNWRRPRKEGQRLDIRTYQASTLGGLSLHIQILTIAKRSFTGTRGLILIGNF